MYNLSIFSTLHSFYVGTMCYTSDIFTRFESTPHRWGITDRSPGPQTYRPSSKSWHETGLFPREFFVVQKHERVKLFHMIWTIKPLGSKRGKICLADFRFFWKPNVFFHQRFSGAKCWHSVGVAPGRPGASWSSPSWASPAPLWELPRATPEMYHGYIMVIYGLSWYMMELSYVIMNSTLENRFFHSTWDFFSKTVQTRQLHNLSWYRDGVGFIFVPFALFVLSFASPFLLQFSFFCSFFTFLRQTPCRVCSRVVYWASGWIQSESLC